METAIRTAIYIHAFFGGIGLLSGTLSLVTKKGGKVHKQSGKWFVIGMLVSSGLSLPIACMPGHHNPFLFLIGVFTIYMVLVGKRVLRFKRKTAQVSKLDWGITITMTLLSVLMILCGILNSFGNNVLFIFFGIISLMLCFQDFRFWRKPRRSKTGWLAQHIGKITGAYIASVTAFLVGGMKMQGLMVWILPSIIGNTFIIYYIIKVRGGFKKRKKVAS